MKKFTAAAIAIAAAITLSGCDKALPGQEPEVTTAIAEQETEVAEQEIEVAEQGSAAKTVIAEKPYIDSKDYEPQAEIEQTPVEVVDEPGTTTESMAEYVEGATMMHVLYDTPGQTGLYFKNIDEKARYGVCNRNYTSLEGLTPIGTCVVTEDYFEAESLMLQLQETLLADMNNY